MWRFLQDCHELRLPLEACTRPSQRFYSPPGSYSNMCRWPLKTLLATLESIFPRGGARSVFVEFVMLRGINDTLEDAHRLLQLLQPIQCKVNLIAFNAHQGTRFRPSKGDQMLSFRYTSIARKLGSLMLLTFLLEEQRSSCLKLSLKSLPLHEAACACCVE